MPSTARRLVERLLLDDDQDFVVGAPLEVYSKLSHGELETSQRTVMVPFMLDLEYRSWGLKEATLIIKPGARATVNVTYLTYDDDGNESSRESSVEVELDRLPARQVPIGSGGLTVYQVYLELDGEGQVDYKTSYLDHGAFVRA